VNFFNGGNMHGGRKNIIRGLTFIDIIIGVNGALISGKIAATSILSQNEALQEFTRVGSSLNKDLFVHTLYWHLPFKKVILSQVMKFQENQDHTMLSAFILRYSTGLMTTSHL
jgi:hypothetical protein